MLPSDGRRPKLSTSFWLVEGEGFEPSKAEPSDLQSDPFDRSGTPPSTVRELLRTKPAREPLRTKPLIMLGFLYGVKLGWHVSRLFSPSALEMRPDPGTILAPTLVGLAASQNGAPPGRTMDDPLTPHIPRSCARTALRCPFVAVLDSVLSEVADCRIAEVNRAIRD